ncbi:hypothetical protein MNEG_8357, partial [Monoraphidium neglectum]
MRATSVTQRAGVIVGDTLRLQAAAVSSAPHDLGLLCVILIAHAALGMLLLEAALCAAERGPPLARSAFLAARAACPVAARLLPVAAATVPVRHAPAARSVLVFAVTQWWWSALWGLIALLHR